MIVKKIKLINFRNYKVLEVDFNASFNMIYGKNAQGKTNILEAMFLCATGRSHRTSKENEMIFFGQPGFYVKIEVEKEYNNLEIEYAVNEGKKSIFINGVHQNKLGNLIGNLSVVLFAPEDIMMLKEGPNERRRFLDIAISQIKPAYFFDLQQYKKALANRNVLLRELRDNKSANYDSLAVWEEVLANTGARIISTRNDFIARIEKIIKPRHLNMTGDIEDISIKYKTVLNESNIKNEQIAEILLKNLREKQKNDISRAHTSIGPHRDDFEIYVNNINVKDFGSQGQQRTAVLSLKLAEIDIVKQITGENPILLLDDFASELDLDRQTRFLESLDNIQVMITSTNKDIMNQTAISAVKYLFVKEGTCI